MLGSFSKAFGAVKDRAVEKSVRAMINKKIEKFGTVTRLEIDSRQKIIYLEAELKGEVAPIGIQLEAYELSQAGDRTFLSVGRAQASREWLEAALNEYVVGRRFAVPEAARMAL